MKNLIWSETEVERIELSVNNWHHERIANSVESQNLGNLLLPLFFLFYYHHLDKQKQQTSSHYLHFWYFWRWYFFAQPYSPLHLFFRPRTFWLKIAWLFHKKFIFGSDSLTIQEREQESYIKPRIFNQPFCTIELGNYFCKHHNDFTVYIIEITLNINDNKFNFI